MHWRITHTHTSYGVARACGTPSPLPEQVCLSIIIKSRYQHSSTEPAKHIPGLPRFSNAFTCSPTHPSLSSLNPFRYSFNQTAYHRRLVLMACNYIITFLLRCVPALIFVCINCYPGFSFLFWRFSVFFPWLKLDFQFVYSLLVVLIWVSFFDFLSPAETNLTYSLSLIWGVAEIQFDFYLSTFVRSPTVAAID